MNSIGSHRQDLNLMLDLLQLTKEQKVAGTIRNPKFVHRKTGKLCDPFFNVREKEMHTKGDGLIIKDTE